MEIPVSSYSCAYQKGSSLSQNAAPHKGQKLLLKLDIHDFFGSISYISVYQHGFPCERIPDPVRTLLAHLCCYKDMLPQAQPASPYLSNLVMKPFDEYMGNWCGKERLLIQDTVMTSLFPATLIPKKCTEKQKDF